MKNGTTDNYQLNWYSIKKKILQKQPRDNNSADDSEGDTPCSTWFGSMSSGGPSVASQQDGTKSERREQVNTDNRKTITGW